MCLGIGAGKNGRVGGHRGGRLRVGLSKDHSLMRNPIQIGSQAAVRAHKAHAVGASRVKRDKDNVRLGRGRGVDRENNQG